MPGTLYALFYSVLTIILEDISMCDEVKEVKALVCDPLLRGNVKRQVTECNLLVHMITEPLSKQTNICQEGAIYLSNVFNKVCLVR